MSQMVLIFAVSQDPYEGAQDMGLDDSDDIECYLILIGAGKWLGGCIAVPAKRTLFTTSLSTNANTTYSGSLLDQPAVCQINATSVILLRK